MAVRVGIGGWDYEPWRETFYPPGLPKARQLEYAAGKLTAIEVNATHYKLQKPDTFRKWAAAVPDGFQFAIKASRFCTNRRELAGMGESLERFLGQGLTELGPKLGPILWQFMGTKRFERDDFAAFLKLLPDSLDGMRLRHALEVRHESFRHPDFVSMAKDKGAAVVFADTDEYPQLEEKTADFFYARLQRTRANEPQGYAGAELDGWAERARGWAERGRDAYIFMIAGAKERAPAAAMGLIERLERGTSG